MLMLSSSSSIMFYSFCHILLLSLIFRYNSGLLSMMQLFSIKPFNGLTSIVSPNDLYDRNIILPTISVLVGTNSFSDRSGFIFSLISLMRVKDCSDFFDTNYSGSTFSLIFFLGKGELTITLVSSSNF